MNVKAFKEKQIAKYGDLIQCGVVYQLLRNSIENLDYDLEEAIKQNAERHAEAEKSGTNFFTTLEFDIDYCKCMQETIDWLEAEGKFYTIERFISLVKKLG